MRLKSSKKHTILVSGASGIVGYGILRSLGERDDCYLIGTTRYRNSPADCFSDAAEIVPLTTDPKYMDFLQELIIRYSVDMIIPGIEADMSAWNQNRQRLEDTGAHVLLNSSNLISLCLDKWLFFQELEKMGYVGRIESSIKPDYTRFEVPFLLKPRCGFGARGIIKIESREQFEKNKDKIGGQLMMQEYVGSDAEEYTISAFFDMNSKVKAAMGMRRKLSPIGYTEMAEVVDAGYFLEDIEKLADIFKPIGPTNFQFRSKDGQLKLLEINPRISSSTSIRTGFGYNESSMAVDYYLNGRDVIQPDIRMGKAIRYTEDFFIYDDSIDI